MRELYDATKDPAVLREAAALTGDVNAVNEAMAAAWQAFAVIPERHPLRISASYQFGQYLEEVYRRTQDPRALDDAVRIARATVNGSGRDPHHSDHLRLLADVLQAVYRDRGAVEALQEAINLLQVAASRLPSETGNAVRILVSLGEALAPAGELTGELGLTRRSEAFLRQALAACGDDGALGAKVAHALALTLMSLYMQTEDPAFLPEAVQYGRHALQATPPENAARGEWAGDLAAAVSQLAAISGDASFRDEAIDLFRMAVSGTTGDLQLTYRYGLWSKLWSAYQEIGALRPLAEAAEHIRAVAAAVDPAGDGYGRRQQALGITLLALHRHTDDPRTLDEAIDAFRNAAPAGAPTADLVGDLLARFRQTGNPAHLEEAIAFGRRAAELEEDQPVLLFNLAGGLHELFNQTGQESAGLEAYELMRRALDLLPETDPNTSTALSNFAAIIDALGRRLRSARIGDEAIELTQLAVVTAPPGHPNRFRALNNLGALLLVRFRRTGQVTDLDEAAAALSEPADDPAGVLARFHLACVEAAREEADGDAAHLRAAVSLAREALRDEETPAFRARMSLEIGQWQYRLMTRYGDRQLEQEALAVLAGAMTAEAAPPYLRLEAARSRAEVLTATESWEEALADYATAVGLIGQVAAHHLHADDKQHQLAELTSLGADAAACALNAGQPRRAVELAEHARGVLIAEAFDADTDLTRLHATAPELADRLVSLRDRLNAEVVLTTPATSIPDDEIGMIALGAPAERQHRLGREWNDLLGEIRNLSGFGTYLEPPPFETLAAAAAEGPVALLNVSRLRCDAIVLRQRDGGITDPQVIRLPGLDLDEVARQAGLMLAHTRPAWFKAEADTPPGSVPDVLEWLWGTVIEPVLDGLGLLSDRPPVPLPRIWWCPTDLLSYLPLHAAGKKDTGAGRRDCALDHVVSSYTPTIRALARSFTTRRGHREPVSALVVAVSEARGMPALPSVATEVRVVTDTCQGALVLDGPQACYEAVVAEMNSHSLVHFACHAVSDQGTPAQSHLVLYDHDEKPLAVADIMRTRTDHAELAFLSACSTAQTSSGLVNEALHITSAFLIAGFPQVIGTLWPVSDFPAQRVVGDFYASYLPGHTGHPAPTAAYALHDAVTKAASRYRQHPLMWASHIHVGR